MADCIKCGPCCCCQDGPNCICTPCCNTLLGKKLFGTITDINNCGCLPGAIVFTWNPAVNGWQAPLGAVCGDTDRQLNLTCTGTSFLVDGTRNGGNSWCGATSIPAPQCCPLVLNVDITPNVNLGPGPTCQLNDSGKFHLKVTWP